MGGTTLFPKWALLIYTSNNWHFAVRLSVTDLERVGARNLPFLAQNVRFVVNETHPKRLF